MDNNDIKILQWNCRSILSNKGSFELYICENNIDICLLSETWLNKHHNFKISGYNIFRNDRIDRKGGGVAIVLKKTIAFKSIIIPPIEGAELVAISIESKDHSKITFISVYIPPNSKIKEAEWNKFFDCIPQNTIIGGDFNLHHSASGSTSNSYHGDELMKSLTQNSFFLLNDGSPTRIQPPNQPKSAVDITFASRSLIPLTHWFIENRTLGSDHFVIRYDLQSNVLRTPSRKPSRKYNTNKCDWVRFDSLMQDFPDEVSASVINYDTFKEKLTTACEVSCPKYKLKKKFEIQ